MTAPYRPPELYDAPCPATLDQAACDVWALGASLFHVRVGLANLRSMSKAKAKLTWARRSSTCVGDKVEGTGHLAIEGSAPAGFKHTYSTV